MAAVMRMQEWPACRVFESCVQRDDHIPGHDGGEAQYSNSSRHSASRTLSTRTSSAVR